MPVKREGTGLQMSMRKYIDVWNTSPQTTIAELAAMFGVSRQWVSQAIISAYRCRLVAETPRQRRNALCAKRREERMHLDSQTAKFCCICSKRLHGRSKVHADGKFYCIPHKQLSPSYRASRAKYMNQRYHDDPAFHQRILTNNARYRQKQASCVEEQTRT